MKLWQKDIEINKRIEKFTIGRDRELDSGREVGWREDRSAGEHADGHLRRSERLRQ